MEVAIATKRTLIAREKSRKKVIEPTAAALAAEAESEIVYAKKAQQRIDAARVFAIKAAKMAKDTHCSNVVILDVSAVSPREAASSNGS